MPEFLIEFIKRDPGGAAFERAQLASLQRIEEAARKAAAAFGQVGTAAPGRSGGGGRSGSAPGPSAGGGAGPRVDVGLHDLQARAARFAQQAERDADRRARADEQAARRAAAAEQRRVTQGMVGLDQLRANAVKVAQRIEREQEKAAEAVTRAEQRELAKRSALYRKLWTDEEIAARVANQKIANQNQARLEAEMKAQGVAFRGWRNGWEGADKLSDRLGTVVAGFLSLGAGVQVLRELGQAAADAAREQERMAEQLIRYRDAQREIQAIQGGVANTRTALEAARFEARTGLTDAESKAFTTEFLNAAAQYEGRRIGGAEFGQYQELLGKLAAAKGIDPAIMANLGGTALAFKDYRAAGAGAPTAALGDFNQALMVLGRGKGDNASMARQLAQLASTTVNEDEMKGIFGSMTDAAALLSTMAEFNPDEAFTYAQASLKGLRSFGDEKAGGLLKRAGITPQMEAFSAINALAPVVTAEASRRNVKVQDVLADYFSDVRTQRGLSVLINQGAGPGGVLEDRLAYAQTVAGAGPALAEIGRAENDPTSAMAARQAAGAGRYAELARGARTDMFETLRQQALARLQARGGIDTTATNMTDTLINLTSPAVMLGFHPGAREDRLAAEMTRMLQERAEQAGLPVDALTLERMGSQYTTKEGMAETFGAMMGLFTSQGVNPLTGGRLDEAAMDDMKAVTADLAAAARDLRAAIQGPAGRPPAANPAPPPLPPAKAPPGGGPAR